jgi:hypothetical protein
MSAKPLDALVANRLAKFLAGLDDLTTQTGIRIDFITGEEYLSYNDQTLQLRIYHDGTSYIAREGSS